MSAFSNYLEGELINHMLRNIAFANPYSSLYIALFDGTGSTAALEAGTLTGEITGGAYARVQVGAATGLDFDDPLLTGVTANSSDITWTTATANWGTVTYMAIMDASTAGNVLFYGTLTVAKTVNNGDTFKFTTGDLQITFD